MALSKTPVMQQHAEAKATHPDAILFFRLGDFYEMFGDDAVLGADLLDLTLTSRNKGKPDEVPMAGIPYHAAHGYIARLLAAGRKVAICEQMADPKTVKGIVPRAVVRVITPGTAIHDDQLEVRQNNWLAAAEIGEHGTGLAFFDLSTGELALGDVPSVAAALAELALVRPREILLGGSIAEPDWAELERSVRQTLPDALVSRDPPLAPSELGQLLPADIQTSAQPELAQLAAGRSVRFARSCNPTSDVTPLRCTALSLGDQLLVEPTAEAHLELVRSATGASGPTLLSTLDSTCSAGGSRLLRRRLASPLRDVPQIRRRLDLVEAFVIHSGLRGQVRRELGRVTDIERLGVRASLGEATPRDLGRLRDGLVAARAAVALLSLPQDPELRRILETAAPVDTLDELVEMLSRALVERPPPQAKDGAIFQADYDPELGELHALRQSGAHHMTELETRLRQSADIPTLKVRYTRVFGWYVEVGRTHARRAPEAWRRKQTVASGERYTLPELEELADKIEHAEERYRARERELLDRLLADVRAHSARLSRLASQISIWDVAAALAEVAQEHDYVRPDVDASLVLEIVDGRHPVVERFAALGRFVPNDVTLDAAGERLWIVTGPNMAGKSTLLRQTALITILAQMGSYVPARRARIGVVDRVLSRVGASDNLARGESTFMVEMRETAEILRSATSRSLVIVDEIGRGTSTFDGLAIAWAVAEHLALVVRCRTLFATHYHEITALGSEPHTANYSVSARELDGDVVFLHRLVHGPASQSYGVAVAKLAGLPQAVLARAGELLALFEHEPSEPSLPPLRRRGRSAAPAREQLQLFETVKEQSDGRVLEALRSVALAELTPDQALALLAGLQAQLSAVNSEAEALRAQLERHPRWFVLTGAGCSTESGIPAYRNENGTWQHKAPIQFRDFVQSAAVRQRYWARSFSGFRRVQEAVPNAAHHALARLEVLDRLGILVTQNVDRLHQKAGSRSVIDLHGQLANVTCLGCRAQLAREAWQAELARHNPSLCVGPSPAAAPDGDADLPADDYAGVHVPSCSHCGGVLKPDVVFYGETVPAERVSAAYAALASADAVLVVGSSLSVFSGYRFVRRARDLNKTIVIVNSGATRADRFANLRLPGPCAALLHEAMQGLWPRIGTTG